MKKLYFLNKKKLIFDKKHNIFLLKKYNKIFKYEILKNKKLIFYLPEFQIKNFLNIFKNKKNENVKIFYYELKVYGLGFKFSKNKNILRLDFGWSHVLYMELPYKVYMLKKKNELIFYSNFQRTLANFVFKLKKIYIKSPYNIKGIFSVHENVKTKLGKQRQK